VYSVGLVLYEALTGRRPIVAEPEMSVVPPRREAWPPDARRFRPDADPRLIAVVGRALDPDPGARFQSAADMARALIDTGPAPTDRFSAASLARRGSGTTMIRPRRPHRQWPPALLGAALLAGVLIAALVLSARSGGSSPASRKANVSTATTAVARPADPVASELRNLARRLTPADGPAAPSLAAGLDRVANLPSSQRPPAATALLAAAASWYQGRRLSPTAYAQSITALTDAGGQPSPPPTSSPPTSSATPPSPAPAKGHHHGKSEGD
jgi:serine/threonine-protein kinase